MIVTAQQHLMRTIDFYRFELFYIAYGSDALIVSKVCGIERQTVTERNATLKFPVGSSVVCIAEWMFEDAFKALRSADWFPRVVAE